MNDGKEMQVQEWIEDSIEFVLSSLDIQKGYEKIIVFAKFIQLVNNNSEKLKSKFSGIFEGITSDLSKFCQDNKLLVDNQNKLLLDVIKNKNDSNQKRKFIIALFDDKNPVDLNDNKEYTRNLQIQLNQLAKNQDQVDKRNKELIKENDNNKIKNE